MELEKVGSSASLLILHRGDSLQLLQSSSMAPATWQFRSSLSHFLFWPLTGDSAVVATLIPFSFIFKEEEPFISKSLAYIQTRGNECQSLLFDNLDRYHCYQTHCILSHTDNIRASSRNRNWGTSSMRRDDLCRNKRCSVQAPVPHFSTSVCWE